MNDIEIKNYIKNLDPELKSFLLKNEWRKELKKICSDYGIKDEKLITNIENETFLVIIGIEYIGNFISSLEKAGVPKIQVGPLSEAVAKNILFGVAEYLTAEEPIKKLPDGAEGSLPDHEEIIKNPITLATTPNKEYGIKNREINKIPIPKPTQAQANLQQTTNNKQFVINNSLHQPTPITQKTNNESGIMNQEKATVKTPPPQATNNSQPVLESFSKEKLQGQATTLSWEERKRRAEEALKKVVPPEAKKYPGGTDPYREQL